MKEKSQLWEEGEPSAGRKENSALGGRRTLSFGRNSHRVLLLGCLELR